MASHNLSLANMGRSLKRLLILCSWESWKGSHIIGPSSDKTISKAHFCRYGHLGIRTKWWWSNSCLVNFSRMYICKSNKVLAGVLHPCCYIHYIDLRLLKVKDLSLVQWVPEISATWWGILSNISQNTQRGKSAVSVCHLIDLSRRSWTVRQ